MGVATFGATDVEIANVSMKRLYAACVFMAATGSTRAWWSASGFTTPAAP